LVLTDRGEDIEGDALLVAVGRKPTVDGLDLESAGLNYSERGIEVDNYLRTNQRHIYACGDVIGGFQFTHYAVRQASTAVRTMLFPGSSTGVRSQVPSAVFADPEVAQCGLSEAEAREHMPAATDRRVARWGIDQIERGTGEILGAQIAGARAGEIIQEFALAIEIRRSRVEHSYLPNVCNRRAATRCRGPVGVGRKQPQPRYQTTRGSRN
jgi:pyruvate/2-oxoglutarate dehydrogenase complex dihydrolipoamide dehydrogenase (E3) component